MPTREATKTYALPADAKWQKLDTVAYRGKHDDIFFLTADLGWYVDGGQTELQTLASACQLSQNAVKMPVATRLYNY